MRNRGYLLLISLAALSCAGPKSLSDDGWKPLFDGKSLSGWKVGENPETFSVDSGMIKVHGKRAHLFYEGPVNNHDFANFHFKADVMTTPGSNSGIYFHSKYQETGWPSTGFEIQVNNSHTDWRRTGSVYAIKDVRETYVKDNEWYTEEIVVVGKTITVKLNGKTINEYTQPDTATGPRLISSGTFVLQGHDPNSRVYYRNIMVKPLPK
jgi:Domain of Unknown Function (DUF1080)